MDQTLIFFIKAQAMLAVFCICYYTLIRRQQLYQLNRWILISGPFLVLLVAGFNPYSESQAALISINLPEAAAAVQADSAAIQTTWIDKLTIVYLAVTGMLILRLAVQLIRLLRVPHQTNEDKFKIIRNDKGLNASFFNRIFIDSRLDEQSAGIILDHEKVHARQLHSADAFFYEILSALCWFNPAIWLLRSELRIAHEHIADQHVAAKIGARKYMNVLLSGHFNATNTQFISQFFSSKTLKSRIMMLQKRKPIAFVRYALLLPIFALFAGVTATAQQGNPETEAEVFTVVDQMPEYPGGNEALFTFLAKNLNYPEKAKQEKTEGVVYASFVVNSRGKVTKPAIARGIAEDIDKETLRVIRMMPDWKPGVHEGKPVNVAFNLPVSFKLSAEEK